MSDHATAPDPEDGSVPRLPSRRVTSGFVVAACPGEPGRVGELVLVPPVGVFLFGRGGDREDDAYPRLALARARPQGTERRSPLEIATLSRQALVVRTLSDGGVEIENLGKTRLLVNGLPGDRHIVAPGDVVEVGSQLVLMFVSRSFEAARSTNGYPEVAFGACDAFGIVGESSVAWEMRARLAFIAKRPGHVLVRGASGTGKELAASAIHRLSSSAGPFVARNAATFPEGLVDAELFGSARGYPNAGAPERVGLIGAADGGTLLLDEFAELPIPLQTHLLRVLDQGEYHRLGESTARKSRFRLIGATNRPLDRLRGDVVARFSFQLELLPLCDRREDIPLLIRHLLGELASRDEELAACFFADGAARIRPRFLRQLLRHDLVNNVRELRSLLLASLEESAGDSLELPAALATHDEAPSVRPPSEPELTPERLQAALDEHNGRIEDTRIALGLASRHVLSRLVKRHGLVIRTRLG